MLDGSKVGYVSFSYDEGRLFDMWSLVHVLAGIVIAFSSNLIGLGYIFSYIGTFIGMTIFEIVEESLDVKETIENKVLDVFYGMVGFAFVYEALLPHMDIGEKAIWTAISTVLVTIGSFLGWRAYRRRTVV